MKCRVFILIGLIFLLSGCSFDPYQDSKYGEMSIDAWFSNKELGAVRRNLSNIDEIISRSCEFVESSGNKYIFSCEIIYKENGETVIPLSKNSKMNVYAVFIRKGMNKYDYKVYDSEYSSGVWNDDEYLNY